MSAGGIIMSNTNNKENFVGGLLIGGTIGTIAGLLLAPRGGKETRKILRKSAQAIPELVEDLSSNVKIQTDRLSVVTKRNWDGTLTRLRMAIITGIEASQLEAEQIKQTEEKNHDI